MAKNIFSHNVNGVIVGHRKKDDFVNATALASAYKETTGKRREVSEWLNSVRTKESINHLSKTTGIPVVNLVEVKEGRGGGTWIHPRLAVRFAMWLSDEFGYMVEEWFATQLTDLADVTEQVKARLQGKIARRTLTDAIADYIKRHPELSTNTKKWLYKNTTDKQYKMLFNQTCQQLMKSRGVGSLRDSFHPLESITVAALEDLAARLVDGDMEPTSAIAEACQRMMVEHRFIAK